MTDIDFKIAGRERLAEVVAVNQQIFEGLDEWKAHSMAEYEEKLAEKEVVFFLAEVDGRIVGDLIAYPRNGAFHCWMTGVLPEYRGQHIATELTEMAEEYARKQGYQKMTARVFNYSGRMLRFKLRRGYMITEVEKHPTDIDKNAVFFELSL